ncbi:MAG: hypothetical protein JW838_01190 [Spirochaetes bacterium]|nr:hypothetical protein [Spirochaetota bacterium]
METTLNIHTSTLEKITTAARVKGIPRSVLILILIKKTMNEISEPGKLGTVVRYQSRQRPEEWRIFHLQVKPDEYEYFLDLRKLLKMSVSLILAMAVKKYINEMEIISTDNYQYKDYTLVKKAIGSTFSWHIIWGCPPIVETFLL